MAVTSRSTCIGSVKEELKRNAFNCHIMLNTGNKISKKQELVFINLKLILVKQ